MDLKFKGKRWLSNKSPKWLETVFSEIDGFISRDKTECAVDQVPTVEDCPDVSQNLLPCSLEEAGYFDAQVGSSKDSDTDETSIDAKLDQSNNKIEEFYDLTSGSCIGEADGDLSKGWEVDCKDSELNGTFDDTIIVVEENDSNDKSGKLETRVGTLDRTGSLGTYFKSMLSIGEKTVDTEVKTFSMDLEVDPSSNCNEKYSDLEEAGCYLSSGAEIDGLKNGKPNGVFDEIIIAKEEDLIEKTTYIVFEENYMKEDMAHRKAEENATNKKKIYRKFDIVDDYYSEEPSWQEKLDQNFPGTKDLPEASALEKVDMVNCVDDIAATTMQSSDIEVVCVENKAVEMEVTSSSNSLSTEIYSVQQLPRMENSHTDENICRSPLHADRCSFEVLSESSVCHSEKDELVCSSENIVNGDADTPTLPFSEMGLSGICAEKKAVEMGLASSNSSLSTESCITLELSRCQDNCFSNHILTVGYASDLPCSVSSSQASQTLSSSFRTMLSNGDGCEEDIEDPGMETIELVDDSEKAKLDGSCAMVDSELLHPASFRALRHKSYKKILQDVFASRKRLRKEYEQLGIIYGDIDLETTSPPAAAMGLLSPAAPSSSSSHHSEKSLPPGSSEPGWELL